MTSPRLVPVLAAVALAAACKPEPEPEPLSFAFSDAVGDVDASTAPGVPGVAN